MPSASSRRAAGSIRSPSVVQNIQRKVRLKTCKGIERAQRRWKAEERTCHGAIDPKETMVDAVFLEATTWHNGRQVRLLSSFYRTLQSQWKYGHRLKNVHWYWCRVFSFRCSLQQTRGSGVGLLVFLLLFSGSKMWFHGTFFLYGRHDAFLRLTFILCSLKEGKSFLLCIFKHQVEDVLWNIDSQI